MVLEQIAKLLIPIDLGGSPSNQMGLRIGFHIRLSSSIGFNYLIPIIYISNKSLETLLLSSKYKYAMITVTSGSALCSECLTDIKAQLMAISAVNEKSFATDILTNLIIEKPETLGPHSLANEWGVYQLDRVAHLNSLTPVTPAYQRKHTLYFKYLQALNKNIGLAFEQPIHLPNATSVPIVIAASSTRVLYIDDEGSKGWTSALRVIFKYGTFVPVTGDGNSSTDFFFEIRNRIKEDWDLILLDLRLLPLEEDIAGEILPIDRYSGTRILGEIKAINEGTQVIIFTASNKAWNMKQLIDLGADGYYIKESPDYLIPDALSLKNYEVFLETAKSCFAKKYLRTIFIAQQEAITHNVHTDIGFLTLSENGLKNSYKLIKQDLKEVAYLNYFQIIENYIELTDAACIF
ncbi:MAG: response regulator, partial [Sphingobacteriaceae bacterium]